jgi:hypothetical protein
LLPKCRTTHSPRSQVAIPAEVSIRWNLPASFRNGGLQLRLPLPWPSRETTGNTSEIDTARRRGRRAVWLAQRMCSGRRAVVPPLPALPACHAAASEDGGVVHVLFPAGGPPNTLPPCGVSTTAWVFFVFLPCELLGTVGVGAHPARVRSHDRDSVNVPVARPFPHTSVQSLQAPPSIERTVHPSPSTQPFLRHLAFTFACCDHLVVLYVTNACDVISSSKNDPC